MRVLLRPRTAGRLHSRSRIFSPLLGLLPARFYSRRFLTPLFLLSLLLFVFGHLRSDLPPSKTPITASAKRPPASRSLPGKATFRLPIPALPTYLRRTPEDDSLDWGDGDKRTYDAHVKGSTPRDTGYHWHVPRSVSGLIRRTARRAGAHSEQIPLEQKPSPNHTPQHIFRDDGLLEAVPGGSHPIYDLIRTSEEAWARKVNASSRTLHDAVKEYQRRYRRMPPKGFDHWWNYAVENDVQLPDEYDQIYHDLEPFWGLRPSYVMEQQRLWEKDGEVGSYTIVSKKGHVFFGGHSMHDGDENVALERARDHIKLLRQVQEWLPEFRATFSAHDVPYQFIGHDLKSSAIESAAIGEHVDVSPMFESQRRGWAYACPETSALRSQSATAEAASTPPVHSFIWDHKKSMDPCHHADHLRMNGFLSSYEEGPIPRRNMVPSFSLCKTHLHADILTIPTEMWTEDIGVDPLWHEKRHDRLLWRGRNTGIYFGEDGRWNDSQRVRLVRQTNLQSGLIDVLNSTSSPGEPLRKPAAVPLKLLNDELMDIGFSGSAIQCDPEICREVERTLAHRSPQTFEEAHKWKYILDVDGNGWSARFKRLMTSRSLILKSTIFPEWFTDRVQPWVHYVPIKNDFTDLYDVFSFFHGDVNGNNGHDALAEKIASQGRAWSLAYWRQPDMVAYMSRLMLEYARVMSHDREAATMSWDDVEPTHERR